MEIMKSYLLIKRMKAKGIHGVTLETLDVVSPSYSTVISNGTTCSYMYNSYTIGCPPVRGESTSLSILYHLHQCRSYTLRDISC